MTRGALFHSASRCARFAYRCAETDSGLERMVEKDGPVFVAGHGALRDAIVKAAFDFEATGLVLSAIERLEALSLTPQH